MQKERGGVVQPKSFRLSVKALKALEEILKESDDKDQTALIERLLKEEWQRMKRRQRREAKEGSSGNETMDT